MATRHLPTLTRQVAAIVTPQVPTYDRNKLLRRIAMLLPDGWYGSPVTLEVAGEFPNVRRQKDSRRVTSAGEIQPMQINTEKWIVDIEIDSDDIDRPEKIEILRDRAGNMAESIHEHRTALCYDVLDRNEKAIGNKKFFDKGHRVVGAPENKTFQNYDTGGFQDSADPELAELKSVYYDVRSQILAQGAVRQASINSTFLDKRLMVICNDMDYFTRFSQLQNEEEIDGTKNSLRGKFDVELNLHRKPKGDASDRKFWVLYADDTPVSVRARASSGQRVARVVRIKPLVWVQTQRGLRFEQDLTGLYNDDVLRVGVKATEIAWTGFPQAAFEVRPG